MLTQNDPHAGGGVDAGVEGTAALKTQRILVLSVLVSSMAVIPRFGSRIAGSVADKTTLCAYRLDDFLFIVIRIQQIRGGSPGMKGLTYGAVSRVPR